VKDIVHPVFSGEEIFSVFARAPGHCQARIPKRLNITTRTESFVTNAVYEDCCDGLVITPGQQTVQQDLDHVTGQRVQ
jgi:hypothetical protein